MDEFIIATKGDGSLSIKNIYSHLINDNEDCDDGGWRNVWRLNVSIRLKSFIWLCKHERLLTNLSKSQKCMG